MNTVGWRKKVFSVVLIMAMVMTGSMAFCLHTGAENKGITVSTAVSKTDEQNHFLLSVWFRNNPGIMGFKLKFEYDDTIIAPLAVTEGEGLNAGQLTDNIGVKKGEFNVLWNHLKNDTCEGEVFIIHFERLANTATRISLSYSQEDTFDEDWNDVQLVLENVVLEAKVQPCRFLCDFSQYSSLRLNKGTFIVFDALKRKSFENVLPASQIDTVVEVYNRVDVFMKPMYCVSLRVNGICAADTVNMNVYLHSLQKSGLFNADAWAVGDIDENDVIDIEDVSRLLMEGTYGTCGADEDLNGDERIDMADISTILSAANYGRAGITFNHTPMI